MSSGANYSYAAINNTLSIYDFLGDVTAASLEVWASCEIVAPVATRVTGFADGTGVSSDNVERTVSRIGIDGMFVAGFVYRPLNVTLTLLPRSDFYLEVIRQAIGVQYAMIKPLEWAMEISYPAVKKRFNFWQGVMATAPSLPNAEETLANIEVSFTFGREEIADMR